MLKQVQKYSRLFFFVWTVKSELGPRPWDARKIQKRSSIFKIRPMVNKLSTENAEIYLGWTENILDTMPFGKKDNFTIITWLTLGVTWGALKRFSHRFQIISPVLCGWKTFDTLLELKRRIRIFSCVVWNGSCQTRTPHERHESSEQTTTDEHHIFPCSIDDKNTIRETKHQLTCIPAVCFIPITFIGIPGLKLAKF